MLNSKDPPIVFGMKTETAAELYGLLRKEDGKITSSLQGFLDYLEKELMNRICIEELEEWIDQ